MKNWLFLRGEYDKRTLNSLITDDDVYLQLFEKLLAKDDCGYIYFKKDYHEDNIELVPMVYKHKPKMSFCYDVSSICEKIDVVIARGAFSWQADILMQCTNAYKIRYGAGKRYIPESDIKYDLVLVDTELQKMNVLRLFPGQKVEMFIKPAARHFKSIDCEKEYDVCYIANEQQYKYKGIEWVYETVPKDLKVLHLGYHGKFTPPDNVTQKRVDRIDMTKWINKCKIGIVPYDSVDSCPRVIPEMLACGLPVVCLDTVNFWKEKYFYSKYWHSWTVGKDDFWDIVNYESDTRKDDAIARYYQENLSISIAANHIRSLIEQTKNSEAV